MMVQLRMRILSKDLIIILEILYIYLTQFQNMINYQQTVMLTSSCDFPLL